MLVRAVAAIDHAGIQPLGEELRRARAAVPEYDDVREQRFEILCGVLQRLAFREARCAGGNIDHVRAEAECGELERRPRARARLDEKIHQRLAAQRGDFFHLACADVLKCGRGVEELCDFRGAEGCDGDEILAVPRGLVLREGGDHSCVAEPGVESSHTASSGVPSVAENRT